MSHNQVSLTIMNVTVQIYVTIFLRWIQKNGTQMLQNQGCLVPKPWSLLRLNKGPTVLGTFIANSSRNCKRSGTLSCEGARQETKERLFPLFFLSQRVQLSQSYLPISPMLQKQLTPFLPEQITVASMSRLGSWYHLQSYSTY